MDIPDDRALSPPRTGRKLKEHVDQIEQCDDKGCILPDGTVQPPLLCEEFAARRRARAVPSGCTLPPELLVERVIRFDASAHPLVDVLATAVGAKSAELNELHHTERMRAFLQRRKHLGCTPVDASYKASGGCRFNPALKDCYLGFLREVVMPRFPDARGLLYQREPNLRCHLPGTGRQLVLRHCDADYHHQPNEINIWVPCTACYGTNALWVESAPGRADYHPIEMQVGEFLQFYGHQCDHFTFPNDTEHTRLSLDFRVVPCSHFLERYDSSHHPNGRPRFGQDAFFALLEPTSSAIPSSAHPLDAGEAAAPELS